MQNDPRPFNFKISLRLTRASEDLANCSIEFGLEPSHQWKSGDARVTPRGTPLDGFREASYWTAPLDTSAYTDLESALFGVAEWLSEHKTFLGRHVNAGGSAELFIGFFLEAFNAGFVLNPDLLEKYASVGVALGFDIYERDEPETDR